ncbi:hypothetical protein ARAM_001430 [Aspergillus rambellii]|uniref:Uncharacterized protein n=1 Tax=Aspergillus rambellii TaxID=308745 RepID=A0A0F8VH36_9EURO|nr:hypothetical protein ARAM_001430 [Aspergillus rambellii]
MMGLLLTKFNLEIWKMQLRFLQGATWSGNRQVTGCGGVLKPTQEDLSVNKPSDIFSFALVCICAVHKRIIFAVRAEELEEGVDPLAVVIERQISCFADEHGLNGFLKHLGDNPWVRVFEVTRDGFNQETPREPFAFWNGIDDDFKSLALEHRWFEGV